MPPARTKKDDGNSPPSDDPSALLDSKDAGDKPQAAKRKRQSQSCDACRARKVRCSRENPDDLQQSCKHCIALGIKCTYDYQPKKRGPPNLYLRRLQEAAAAQALAQQQVAAQAGVGSPPSPFSDPSASPSLSHSLMTIPSTASATSSPSASPGSISAGTPQSVGGHGFFDHSMNALLPSTYPIAADASPFNFGFDRPLTPSSRTQRSMSVSIPSSEPNGRPSSSSGLSQHGGHQQSPSPRHHSLPLHSPVMSDAYASPHFGANPSPSYGWSMPAPTPNMSSATSASVNASLAGLTGVHRTYPPLSHFAQQRHSLNNLPVSREQILDIIGLFFNFVYPLTPCIHKPSFLADLHSRREERDPLFFALVLSTVASTLVQVPRSYLPFFDRSVVRKLALYCSETSRLITVAGYDSPNSMQVVIRYFDTVYHFCEGHDATSHACFGEAAHIAVTLHMHEEASYEGLDPIETEMRRRVFWLLFGADKSMAILLGRPICLRDEDCTLHFPKEVDDEFITLAGVQEQPRGTTAIVSGLNYCTRIFALLGEILVRIRVDKRAPPQGSLATDRLAEIRALHTRIIGALAHAPAPLKLKVNPNSSNGNGLGSADYGGLGSRNATFAEVRNFFDNPNASRVHASNPFLVMQANLYVTQQLVRFVIEQYRDELVSMIRMQAGPGVDTSDLTRGWTSDDREAVASDLLKVLHTIPIQCIATNGPSLVHKVRFVASTLLDAVRKAETDSASAARAHAYLWDFLSILSEIERNYLLDDDRDDCTSTSDAVSIIGN